MGIPDGESFWRQHYGIAGRWTSSPHGRRGCMILLAAGLVVLVALMLIGLVVAIT